MMVDAHGYNTRSFENMNLYVPKYTKKCANVILQIKYVYYWMTSLMK